jgi:hypothetical protein
VVRAYQKPGSQGGTYRYCPNCDEWEEEGPDWTQHTAYTHYQGNNWAFYDNDSDLIFGEPCDEIIVWSHDSCEEYFVESESEERGIWICGNCKTEWSEQDQARRCCS